MGLIVLPVNVRPPFWKTLTYRSKIDWTGVKFPRYHPFRAACGSPCPYCRRPMDLGPGTIPTKDHLHPKSKGGNTTIWACWTCNNIKTNMALPEWEAFMAANPEWWLNVGAGRGWRAKVTDWPWLRATISARVQQVGFGPWTDEP